MISKRNAKRTIHDPLGPYEKRIKERYGSLTHAQLKAMIDGEAGRVIPMSRYREKFKQLGLRKYHTANEINQLSITLARRSKEGKTENTVLFNGRSLSQSQVERMVARSRPDIFTQLNSHQLPSDFVVRSSTPSRAFDYLANTPFPEFQKALYSLFQGHEHQNSEISPQILFGQRDGSSDQVEWMNKGGVCNLGDTFFNNNPHALTALKAIIPSSGAFNLLSQGSLGRHDSEISNHALRRQLLFSIANNFAGMHRFPVWQPFKLLQNVTVRELNQLFRLTQGPTIRAIAQNLFKASIEKGSHITIDAILSIEGAKINVNDEKIFVNGHVYTPVERASMLGHYETVEVLLRYHANVDKTYYNSHNPAHGALECFLDSRGRPDMRTFQLLVEATRNISPKAIYSIITRHEDLFLYITKHHAKNCEWLRHLDSSRCIMNTDFVDEVDVFDDTITGTIRLSDEPLYRIVANFSEQGAIDAMETIGNIPLGSKLLAKALGMTTLGSKSITKAARRGFRKLYDKLRSEYGCRPDEETLVAAVECGDISLIQIIISDGAPIHESWLGLSSLPLVAAIGSQRKEIIDIFRCNGAFHHFSSWWDFERAWKEAERTNNEELLNEMMRIFHEISGEHRFSAYQGWALRQACRTRNDHWIRDLLERGACVTNDLLKAVLRNMDIRLVEMLLDSGGLANEELLTVAVECGGYAVVQSLLAEGVKPAKKALHVALIRKDKKLVGLLLDAGVDIDGALQVTARMEGGQWTKYVLDKGADPNDSEALEIAYRENATAFEIILAAYKKRYNRRLKGFGSLVLVLAIKSGDLTSIRMLLEHNADPHGFVQEDNELQAITPFGHAIITDKSKGLAMVTTFLDCYCCPSDVVSVVSSRGNKHLSSEEQSRQLIGKPRMNAFLAAIATENTKLIELLVQKDKKIIHAPACKSIKRTPLQRATEIGSMNMVKLLHNLGAHVDDPPNRDGGATALQLAAIGGFGQIVCYLIDHGADVNGKAAFKNGMTALVGAASQGRLDIVAILLNCGAGRGEDGDEQFEKAIKEAGEHGHYPVRDYLRERWEDQRREDPEPENESFMDMVVFDAE
ncbi:ankyrin [Xylaria curta]|nr:ankyrin [Xylaria curta]